MKKYPSIHGGATYVLPIMLSSDGAGIEGDVVATYRVGTETTSRNCTIEDVGTVPDPRAPATAEVYRYDCVIDAATTAALGPDAMVTLDIDVTINSRVYHVVGAVVQYYAYGGEVENTPQGAHVVLNVAPIVTIVTVLAGNGGGGEITTADITDMTDAGVALATAEDAAEQLSLIGAASQTALAQETNFRVFGDQVLTSNLDVERNQRIAADDVLTDALNGKASSSHTHLLATGATDVTITAANLNTLDDGVSTTLHYHDSDRARANHTGTQAWSTITGTPTTLSGYGITNALSATPTPVANQIAIFDAASSVAGNSALRFLSGSLHFSASSNNNFITGAVGGNGLTLSAGGSSELSLTARTATFGQWSGFAQTIKGPSAGGGNTNRAATPLNVQAGAGTGSGTAAGVSLWYSPPIASGATSQTLVKGAELDGLGAWVMYGAVRKGMRTVGTLPIAPTVGDEWLVTDALAPAYDAPVVAGGARLIAVRWNGANWNCC